LRTGAPQFPHWRKAHASAEQRAREMLGEAAFESAWREGVRVGPRQAVASALEFLSRQQQAAGSG
jgi:hypothetical protein